jgi:flavin reductase (DIM6/NTAB) family NADH-FMN oxidoreductase RutF
MKKELAFKYLSYPAPVFVIGTYDADNRPNAMTVVLGGMCSHDPPSFAISVGPKRYSYQSIVNRKAFTVNVPTMQYVRETDYVGIYTGRKADKFADCGLTAVRGEVVDAPYVEEFPAVAECELRHTIDLGSHTMFIGEIVNTKGEESLLTDITVGSRTIQGIPDMGSGLVLTFTQGSRYYCAVGEPQEKAYTVGRLIHRTKGAEG